MQVADGRSPELTADAVAFDALSVQDLPTDLEVTVGLDPGVHNRGEDIRRQGPRPGWWSR
ncbi:hypothetical protein [Nocardia asiatica]|uniref:hypothetical protein n=1 Tax=Nocardia asiatica TaxID=209252 RepID=UPI002455477F|nr:hypothetical protein [Nocardia asiatica]